MTVEEYATYATAIFLLIGAFFTFVGAIGLVRFPDAMTRLHAPTKVGTMGIGALLLAAMIYSFLIGDGSFHGLLIMAFLFLTAPISANFMSKVNIHRKSCVTPPDASSEGEVWSTLAKRDGEGEPE